MSLMLVAALFVPAAPVPKDTTRDDALKILVEKSKDSDEKVRAEAVRRLGTLEHPPAVHHIEKFLKDENSTVRLAAILALTRHGKAHEQTVTVFKELEYVEFWVPGSGYTLSDYGIRSKPFAKLLRERVITSPPYFTAGWVENALPGLGELIPDAAGDFVSMLNAIDVNGQKHRGPARAAAMCLGKIGKPTPETIAALERWTTEAGEDHQVGREAAVSLLKLDPKNKVAKEYLQGAAERSRQSSVGAGTLTHVNSDGAFTSTIVRMATNAIPCDREYRLTALDCVAKMGQMGKGEAQHLLPVLDEADLQIQSAALVTLMRIDTDRIEKLLPKLLDTIERGADLSDARCDPLRFLIEQERMTKDVRRMLHDRLKQSDPLDRQANRIAAALFETDPDDPVAVMWFESRLKNWAEDSGKPRSGSRPDLVFQSLQQLGSKGRRFTPTLMRLLAVHDFKSSCGDLVSAIRETTK